MAEDAPLWTSEEDETYARAARPRRTARVQDGAIDRPALDGPTPRRTARGRAAPGGGRGRDDRSAAAREAEPPRDPAEWAREICLELLALRPRTRTELATAMRRRDIADEVATAVLDRYGEVGLIDDAAFARAWVTSRHHGRGLAGRALAGELRRRGLDNAVVGEALAELDSDTEAATARALVDRKLRGMGSVAPDAVFRRLVGMLARKGYGPGMAVRVVKDALAERDAEASAYADMIDPDALGDLGDSGDVADSGGLADGGESNLSDN